MVPVSPCEGNPDVLLLLKVPLPQSMSLQSAVFFPHHDVLNKLT